MSEAFSRPPLALIASGHEWSARSFESILGPNGYAVLRAYTGRQALEQARGAHPDVVFIDAQLPDYQGIDLCRALREDPAITPQTPIYIMSGPIARQDRMEGLKAGAYEHLVLPLDAEELLLKLNTVIAAKFEADRVRDESLLDQMTGFYNAQGIIRRARELGAEAFRFHRALACIVISPEPRETEGGGGAGKPPEVDSLAEVFRSACRACDAIGRLGDNEFVIIAPDTDAEGARRFAERIAAAVESAAEGSAAARVRVGFFGVRDFQAASIEPTEMLVRATMALRRSQAAADSTRIRAFDLNPQVSLS